MKRFSIFLLLLVPVFSIQSQTDDLTLEQKVGQMFLLSFYGENITFDAQDIIETWNPGGIVLFGGNINTPEQITRLTNAYQTAAMQAHDRPLFIATDQEGGWIARLRQGFTEWPPSSLLTATADYDLAFQAGTRMGIELSAVGINMNLAPVADLDTNVFNPIIGRRSPGSNLSALDQTLPGYIAGLQAVGVAAVTKHFPGHGDTDEDSHLTLPEIPHDLARLRQLELQPFISAIDGETGAIMMAHLWHSAIDPEPLPSSLSHNIVTGLLREELGYEGVIMTDAMDMDSIDTRYNPGEAAVLAVQAGVDMISYGTSMGQREQIAAMQAIVDAVRRGEISESRIDESVERITRLKDRLDLFDWQPLDPATARDRIDLEGTAPLIDALFEAGVTIAFDDNDLLPVSDSNRVGIVYPGQRISINRECGALREEVQFVAVSDFPDQAQIDAAVTLAGQVDVVLVFTRNITESPSYQTLINALPSEKTVAVALRSPYDLTTYPDVAGYVLTYGPQPPAIPAVCGVLFGALPARGTLATNLGIDR
jgi:beta-N-acetylhexosaminidase